MLATKLQYSCNNLHTTLPTVSTCLASCQPIKQVANLIDLSRHVVIMATKKVATLLATSWQQVGNPGCQPGFQTSSPSGMWLLHHLMSTATQK